MQAAFLWRAVKNGAKSALFAADPAPHCIKFGLGRGVVLMLSRRHHLQVELGLYERELHSAIRSLVGPSAVVYDVGASFGNSALPFASLATAGHVVAFEPDREARQALHKNLQLNPSLARRVTVLPLAAGTGADSLDTLVASERPAPTFLKIDVEGAEVDVLRGAVHTLRDRHPAVLIEIHGGTEADCRGLLDGAGYTVRHVGPAWWRHLLPEHRPGQDPSWLVATFRSPEGSLASGSCGSDYATR